MLSSSKLGLEDASLSKLPSLLKLLWNQSVDQPNFFYFCVVDS
jgi:hypothetical protein